jgi:YidC/Oxa1 family membrane protein insertase
MKKFKLPSSDVLIIAALFALMMAWGPFYQKFFAPPPAPVVRGLADTNAVTRAGGRTSEVAVAAARLEPAATAEPAQPIPVPAPAVVKHVAPEQTVTLSNGVMRLTLSSWGAGVTAVELSRYPMTRKAGSGPVVLDFADQPALAYDALPGLDTGSDFTITVISNGAAARLEAQAADGVRLVRTITLTDRYQVKVDDAFINGPAPAILSAHTVTLGSMGLLPGEKAVSGVEDLGIDSLPSAAGESVRFWARKGFFSKDVTIAGYFDEPGRVGRGCVGKPAMTRPLPGSIRERIKRDMDWVAAKNKFFVQILAPAEGSTGIDLIAERTRSPGETEADPRSWDQVATLKRVTAAARFAPRPLAAGETYTRSMSYYVGPKEMASLRPLGHRQAEIMDFGMFRWVCEGLLWALVTLYKLIPNYGVAIILLTLIVRVVFWPLTHKGTESMKRMQEIQPKLNELKEKFKDKPQKLQQETMAMYREHKINPLGGCLPMLIQIPVFFALYNVLRSGIEMRFAPFLWIPDLSAPEGLLAGVLPGGWTLNILPLLMAATQAWQQHLTPTGGDPAQQKMMMFMPLIMLMFLYSMPSALVLYWTANQVLMIIQLLRQKRMAKAAVPAVR